MAERERCHCGDMPVTVDGYCSKHKHLANPSPRVRSCEEKLAEAKQARHWLNEDLLKAHGELRELKSRVQHLEALLMRVQIGDIKPQEINRWT